MGLSFIFFKPQIFVLFIFPLWNTILKGDQLVQKMLKHATGAVCRGQCFEKHTGISPVAQLPLICYREAESTPDYDRLWLSAVWPLWGDFSKATASLSMDVRLSFWSFPAGNSATCDLGRWSISRTLWQNSNTDPKSHTHLSTKCLISLKEFCPFLHAWNH